jgi:4-amino-4-deoxy-L-arabinose transferase-like glycosyltransferase
LFLAAFFLRLFLVLTAKGIATDGCTYLWLADDILKGDFQSGINAFLPPLFPIFSAGALFFFGELELSGRMVSCILGALTVFPLFFLVKDIFDRKVAIVTVIFFMIHPYLLRASGEVLTEATYFFLITSLAWTIWLAIRRKKIIFMFLTGFLASLIFLTRSEGFVIILLGLGWIWLSDMKKWKENFRWKFIATGCVLITYISFLSPFYLHIHSETNNWRPTSRRLPFLDDKESTESWPSLVIRVIKDKLYLNVPGLFLAVPKAYYPPFLVLAFFGLIKRKRFKGFRKGEGFILSFAIYRILIITCSGGMTDRYFYSFIPIALCWAGVGFWEVNDRLLEKYPTRKWKFGPELISRYSIMILLVIAVLCLPKGLRPIRSHRAIQKKAGYWLRENAGKSDFTVMANNSQEAFYAGGRLLRMVKGSYDDVIIQARAAKADFIIIDKHIDRICPEFKSMVRQDDLEVISAEFEDSDRKIVIYKVNQ